MWAIAKKDFKALFFSPIGYIVVAIFLATMGIIMYLFTLSARAIDFNKTYEYMAKFVLPILVGLLTMKAFSEEKYVAAVCAAPSILAELGLMKIATVHPDFKNHMNKVKVADESVVVDGNIITGQGLGATIPFAFELVKTLADEKTAERIAKAICYRWSHQ